MISASAVCTTRLLAASDTRGSISADNPCQRFSLCKFHRVPELVHVHHNHPKEISARARGNDNGGKHASRKMVQDSTGRTQTFRTEQEGSPDQNFRMLVTACYSSLALLVLLKRDDSGNLTKDYSEELTKRLSGITQAFRQDQTRGIASRRAGCLRDRSDHHQAKTNSGAERDRIPVLWGRVTGPKLPPRRMLVFPSPGVFFYEGIPVLSLFALGSPRTNLHLELQLKNDTKERKP